MISLKLKRKPVILVLSLIAVLSLSFVTIQILKRTASCETLYRIPFALERTLIQGGNEKRPPKLRPECYKYEPFGCMGGHHTGCWSASWSLKSPQDFADERDFPFLQEQAEKGDMNAQRRLGDIYADGAVTPKNWKEAYKWYAKAAQQGDQKSQNIMRNKKRNDEHAKKWKEDIERFQKPLK